MADLPLCHGEPATRFARLELGRYFFAGDGDPGGMQYASNSTTAKSLFELL